MPPAADLRLGYVLDTATAATGIDSSWLSAPAPGLLLPRHGSGHGSGSPYGVLILTAADKLLNAGSCSSFSECFMWAYGCRCISVYVCVCTGLCVCAVAYKFI